ncbi:carcinine transporter isoform X3 [Pogonomyrmex barbatus]|uniref:Carcinine transporter isoform X3 n=1 Tax=Pogonomyrmex barbatus TaxID=144034 RepID=A0A6I9VSZ0_9HYME|nr:carcinine transporter isoform X3 [Pogonomyrmex barbatus]
MKIAKNNNDSDVLLMRFDRESVSARNVSQDDFDLDDLLPIVGEFGRYQKQLLWLVCLPACLPCGFCAFNQLFMADTPSHWCKVPGLENMDSVRRRRLAIPASQDDNETYSQCTRYDIDWTTTTTTMENYSIVATYSIPNTSWSVVPCDHGWEYEASEMTSSIVIDFDLVCDRAIYPTIGLVALNTGGPIGVYLFGTLNDRFLPESPRWLLAKGRLSEANDILETLARVNGKELPVSFTQKLRQRMTMSRSKSEEERLRTGPGVLSLFKTPNMCLKTCLITLNWFANNMVYVGLSYYGPALGNEEHLSFLFSSLAEIPSYIACWVVMDRWGRRWPLCLCMVVAGVSCVATVLLSPDAVTETLILFLISKSAISASFLIIYPFAGELYPTQLRGVAIGFSAYVSGLGLIIIPFVTYLGKENLVLPLVILGVISVIGGLSGLRLPETLHHRLPQTVEEGELFGKNWSCADCIRCVPIKPSSITTSYENLSTRETVEMQEMPEVRLASSILEERPSTANVRRLVRQSSVMDTQRDSDGTMKMTYWF